jgi:hypothetical protein
MPTSPQDRKPKAPKPSDIVDDRLEREAARQELLSDMPELTPAARFRPAQRNTFTDLSLTAMEKGVFDRGIEFDLKKKEEIARYREFMAFVESIDAWAESIAIDKEAYAEWAEGKTEEHMFAILAWYQDQMGESTRSAN